MAKSKKKKKSAFSQLQIKVRLLPMYWKLVFTLILFFGGLQSTISLLGAKDDLAMFFGVVVAVVCLWILINMWWPMPEEENEKK